MEETKSTPPPAGDAPSAPTRDEQATSSKTLSDLEETQSDAVTSKGGGGASDTSSPVEGSSPSPDGGDTGGPM